MGIGTFCYTLTWHWTWFDGTRFEVFSENQDRVVFRKYSKQKNSRIFKYPFFFFCSALCLGFVEVCNKQREAITHCLLSYPPTLCTSQLHHTFQLQFFQLHFYNYKYIFTIKASIHLVRQH